MSAARVLVAALFGVCCFNLGACKKKDGGDPRPNKGDTMAAPAKGDTMAAPVKGDTMAAPAKGDSGKPKLSAKDNPRVGDSCKGLGITDGVMACVDNIKIFCSSYSRYKWKKFGECKGGTKCVLEASGRSASCK